MVKSISAVREECGFTIQEVSSYIGVSVKKLRKYEIKPSKMPLNIAKRLLELYKIHIDLVCFK